MTMIVGRAKSRSDALVIDADRVCGTSICASCLGSAGELFEVACEFCLACADVHKRQQVAASIVSLTAEVGEVERRTRTHTRASDGRRLGGGCCFRHQESGESEDGK